MNLNLYVNASEKNKIGKTLTNTLTIQGTLKEETNLINPSIVVEGDDFSQYNYAYIPKFKRKYFIESMDVIRKNLWRLNLRVDVLDSFKTQILAQHVILSGSEENGANDYLSGQQWVPKVKSLTDIINFSSGLLDSGEYILITAGG